MDGKKIAGEDIDMQLHKMMSLARAVGKNDVDRIEAICDEALARDRCDYFALSVLADTWWRAGQFARALPFALRILEIDPLDFAALRIAAHVQHELGNTEDAYALAKRVCESGLPSAESFDTLARIARSLWWLPGTHRWRNRATQEPNIERESQADFLRWAQEYVAWCDQQALSWKK